MIFNIIKEIKNINIISFLKNFISSINNNNCQLKK